MVTAVATAAVPKFTVIIGGSFGAGNYGMCGRAYSPRFLWMWPNARIWSWAASRPRRCWRPVRRDGIEAQRRRLVGRGGGGVQGADPRAVRGQGHPYYASARLWDDGVIDPADTRTVLGLGLSAASTRRSRRPRFGVFRM